MNIELWCKTFFLFFSVPATLSLYPSDTVANLFGNINLTCAAHGFPEPTIAWEKINGNLSTTDIVQTTLRSGGMELVTSTLEIRNIDLPDAGMYKCTATNNVIGVTVTDSRNFTLTVCGKH